MSGQRKPVLTGGCQCGAVRYALYAKPDRAGICHCRMCQKAVGGPFKAWANVRDARLRLDARHARHVPQFVGRGSWLLLALRHAADFRYVKRPDHQRDDRQPGHPAAVTPAKVDGDRKPARRGSTSLLALPPSQATGEGDPPEDLSRITTIQHPDHDTPADWRPPAA